MPFSMPSLQGISLFLLLAVPPRQSENYGGARRDIDVKQHVPEFSRPLLPAGKTR